jgi:2'-5' RNA ligase
MSDQLNLFGGSGVPPDGKHPARPGKSQGPRKRFKLFFAILPGLADAERISKLGASLDLQYGIGGQPLRTDRLHITLQVLGEYDERPESDIAMARQAADAVVADAFDVEFDRAMTFRTPSNPYVLRVGDCTEQIEAFWLNLGIEISNIRPFKRPPFTPHMTLSYKGRHMEEHAVEPLRWTAREFVLINSHVGDTYHEPVGHWPLRA